MPLITREYSICHILALLDAVPSSSSKDVARFKVRNLSETAHKLQSQIVIFTAKIKLDSLIAVAVEAQAKGVLNEHSFRTPVVNGGGDPARAIPEC